MSHFIGVAPLLAGLGQEVGGEDVVHAVLDVEQGVVLDGVLGDGVLGAPDIRSAYRQLARTVVINGHVGHRHEEAIDGEEIRDVLLCGLADFLDELHAAVEVAACAPQRERVFAQQLEQGGVEVGLALSEMVVEVELPVHAELAIYAAGVEGLVARKLIHHGGERRTDGRNQTGEVAAVVGEEVVGGLCAALEVDGSLVVVAVLVACAPLVHIGIEGVEAVADTVEAVVGHAVGCGVGIARIAAFTLDGENGVIVIEGIDSLAAREVVGGAGALAGGYGFRVAHEILLPHGDAVVPGNALVHRCGEHGLERRLLEMDQGVAAAKGEARQGGRLQQRLVVGVAVAGDVIVAVHLAALDMDLDVGPLAERLGHGLGVGDIEDVVERILPAGDDVEAFHQPLSRLGTGDELVLDASCGVQRGVGGYVAVNEDIELVAIFLSVDTRWVAHVGAAGTHHLVVPIAGIAISLIAVDAEVLLVGGPGAVLDLEGNGRHEIGQTRIFHGGGQRLVAHGLILGLQLRAGSILEIGAAEPVDDIGRVLFLGIGFLEVAHEVILLPVRGLVVW